MRVLVLVVLLVLLILVGCAYGTQAGYKGWIFLFLFVIVDP